MTIINVVIESTFSGPAGGFHGITIDDSQPVKELISQFCRAKGAPTDPSYGLITKSNVILINKQPISDFFISDGEILKLISMKNNSKLQFRQWLTMAAIGMFVGIIGIVICVLFYAVYRNVPDNVLIIFGAVGTILHLAKYAMVIDAGSTHTDMILYSWPGRKRNNTGEVTQVYTCSASGGIAQIAPENITAYFDPCFDEAYNVVQEESRKHAEVLFGATAGMRLLNITDPTTAKDVIAGVKSYLNDSGWEYKDANVGIIAGSTEGVSGWITANFLEKTVLKKGGLNDTFGAMDLGGASTQISFEVSESSKDSPDVYQITLFGNKFHIFSQSFLCHGVVQALRRYRTVLKTEQFGSSQVPGNILSPCENLDYKFILPDSYFNSVCTGAINSSQISPGLTNWTIIGTGNFTECQRVVSKMLNFTECIKSGMGHCIDPSQIPPEVVHRRFYAFAAFRYITSDLRIPSMSSRKSAQDHLEVMCDYNLDQLKEVKAKSTNRKRKFELLCFEGQYMFILLSQIYGFDSDEKWSQIMFENQVKNTTLGWSLGYMVNATEEIAAAPPVPKLKVLPFSLLTVLFIVFVLLSIAFSVHGFKVRKNSSGYQSSKVPSQKSVVSVL